MRVINRQLTAIDPADLAVCLIGAEDGIHQSQPIKGAVKRLWIDVGVPYVDQDRHPHDVLDPEEIGRGLGRYHVHFFRPDGRCAAPPAAIGRMPRWSWWHRK